VGASRVRQRHRRLLTRYAAVPFAGKGAPRVVG